MMGRAGGPLRIMPLGDSLTVFDCRLNAYTSADDRPIFNPLEDTPPISIYPRGTFFVNAPGGYRAALARMLGDPKRLPAGADEVPAWSYVGSQFLCGAHEGYAGETVEWLALNVASKAVAKAAPDIVLLLAGTNDFFWPPPRGSRSPSEVATRLHGLLNATLNATLRPPTVLLSTVTPINETRCKTYHTARWHPGDCPTDMQENIRKYNAMLPSIASEYRSRGHEVNVVVQPTDFVARDYWIWGIHFNETGFEKIAGAWHSAIMRARPMRRAMGLA